MKSNLYYTVEKETITIDSITDHSGLTGHKTIKIYEIQNDKPKIWFELDVRNEDSSEDEIQNWLNDNGFGEREYEMLCL